MIWILYIRFASEEMGSKAVAKTLDNIRAGVRARLPDAPFRYDEINSKKELAERVMEIRESGLGVSEWHVVGFGSPYGPLLGSPAWPEEISAYEWRRLHIPFAKEACAWFYMDGSAGWLAPFIAGTFGLRAYGCERLTMAGFPAMRVFGPDDWHDDAGYDPIAALYAETFADITVRRDECRWLEERLRLYKPMDVLDIGCGNGALLKHLADMIGRGVGVDVSAEAIDIAALNSGQRPNLSFRVIDGPTLPFKDNTFDAIVSLLSFRYLDWDPVVEEMKRVLKPGGHLLIVDMVSSAPKSAEWPLAAADKLKSLWRLRKRRSYRAALKKLVSHPDWRRMVSRHPMRRADIFVWYLKSRFPCGEIRVLNTGAKAKIYAFDSGPVT